MTKENEKKFKKAVTNRVKKELLELDTISKESFENLYSSIYNNYSLEELLDLEISEEKVLTIKEIEEIRKGTEKNLEELDENTKTALIAMQTENFTLLQQVQKDTEKLKMEIKELKSLLYRDELTKVHNRKWFSDKILDSSGKFKNDGFITVIDLDNFKKINDGFSHIVGDKVLKFVAHFLNEMKETKVIRYGGDEFVLMSNDKISEDKLKKDLISLQKEISKKKLKANNKIFKAEFSFGTVRFKKGLDLKIIFEKADKKMYENKKNKETR